MKSVKIPFSRYQFRAWDQDKGVMLYFYPQTLQTYKYKFVFNFFMLEVNQGTCFKDINGKDIYDGDILKIRFNDDNIQNCEVYWNNGFYVDAKRSVLTHGYNTWETIGQIFSYKLEDVIQLAEVIGNIYENNDLPYQKGKQK